MDITPIIEQLQQWQGERSEVELLVAQLRSQITSQQQEIIDLKAQLSGTRQDHQRFKKLYEDLEAKHGVLMREYHNQQTPVTQGKVRDVLPPQESNNKMRFNGVKVKKTDRIITMLKDVHTKKEKIKMEDDEIIVIPSDSPSAEDDHDVDQPGNDDKSNISDQTVKSKAIKVLAQKDPGSKMIQLTNSDLCEKNSKEEETETSDEYEEGNTTTGTRELLIPTQYTLDSDEIRYQDDEVEDERYEKTDETLLPPLPPSQDTFDINHPQVYVPGTLHLLEFPIDSSPFDKKQPTPSSSESTPTKVKPEFEGSVKIKKERSQPYDESYEVEDSQFLEDDSFQFQLPTPISTSKSKPFKLPSLHQNNVPPTFSGPITPLVTNRLQNFATKKHQLTSTTPSKDYQTPSKKPKQISHESETESLDLTYNPQTLTLWSLHDFIVNPVLNDNLHYVFDEPIKGADRKQKCQHGKACKSCEDWYEINRDLLKFGVKSGLKWSDSDKENKSLVDKVSRHREMWSSPHEKANFADFEMGDSKGNKRLIDKVIYERLLECLKGDGNGKFVFKEKVYRDVVKFGRWKLNWDVVNGILR